MNLPIVNISESEYPEVVEVWEASVRATHHFLKEEDIVYFKPLILNEYLKAVDLRAVKNEAQQMPGDVDRIREIIASSYFHSRISGRKV